MKKSIYVFGKALDDAAEWVNKHWWTYAITYSVHNLNSVGIDHVFDGHVPGSPLANDALKKLHCIYILPEACKNNAVIWDVIMSHVTIDKLHFTRMDAKEADRTKILNALYSHGTDVSMSASTAYEKFLDDVGTPGNVKLEEIFRQYRNTHTELEKTVNQIFNLLHSQSEREDWHRKAGYL